MRSFRNAPSIKSNEGEKAAYIYEKFYSLMCYCASKVVKSPADIEDAVHFAMLKIIEHIDIIDISDENRLKNFCARVAKNSAADLLRRRDQNNASLDELTDETGQDFAADAGDPLEIVVQKDSLETIMQTMENLDEKYRDVCIMKYVNGFKEREIAELLCLSPNTVATRISRAKRILREKLGKEKINV